MQSHLSETELIKLSRGLLGGDEATRHLSHLEICENCRRQYQSLSVSVAAELSTGTLVQNSATDSQGMNTTVPELEPAINVPAELARLEQYSDIRQLGSGGMGVVYLARNRLLDRQEVLKVMNREMLDRSGNAERFLREIRYAGKLHHGNIVTAYSAQLIGKLMVLSMEYVPGKDLSKVIQGCGPLPVHLACEYITQAARGLQHAHEVGMVHRDIKPGNLMLTYKNDQPVVKILDFGIAKIRDDAACESQLTEEGHTLGTPDYISPEQIDDSKNADIRSDIYSLGCTLYCLLVGLPPFSGNTVYAKLLAHKLNTATSLHSRRDDLPVELEEIVSRMMAKNPDDRFQTPAEVATALAAFTQPSPEGQKSQGRGQSPRTLNGTDKPTVSTSGTTIVDRQTNTVPDSKCPPPSTAKRRRPLRRYLAIGIPVLLMTSTYFAFLKPKSTPFATANSSLTEEDIQEPDPPVDPTAPPVVPVRTVFAEKDLKGWTTRKWDGGRGLTSVLEIRSYNYSQFGLYGRDSWSVKPWGFVAPAEYHGNHSNKLGKSLLYSIKPVDDEPGKVEEPWLRIEGQQDAIMLRGSDIASSVTQSGWREFRVPLKSSAKWRYTNSQIRVHNAEIKTVLSNVTSIWIRGNRHSGFEWAMLGDVSFGVD